MSKRPALRSTGIARRSRDDGNDRPIWVQGDEGPAELGTVEVGKLADLIVIAANPLDDIANVRRLQLVLKEGRVVSDKRHLSGAIPQPDKARF